MVVVNDAAVGAYRYVNACFLEVFISGLAYFDEGGSLAAADALCFTGDADGTAADAYLDEVSACFGQEEEAVAVNHVAGTYSDLAVVFFMNPVQGDFLPFGEAFGGINAEYVSACIYQLRHPFFIVPGVDAGTDDEAFLGIQHFVGVFLMGIVVLAEYEAVELAIFKENGEGIDFVVPDNVVGFGKGDAVLGGDQFFQRGHEIFNFFRFIHTAHAIVTAGNDAHQFAAGGAVVGNGYGGMAGLCFQSQYIGQGVFRRKVGIAGNKACLLGFDSGNHGCFLFRGLGAVDEGNAAVSCQFHCQSFTGYGLHDCRNHGDI